MTVAAGILVLNTDSSDAARTCFGRSPSIFAVPGERTVGTSGADVIWGTSGPDVIEGKGGADRICARGGADRVYGGRGDDRINLGSGNDFAKGGPGDDLIRGKRGRDEILGGGGEDTLVGGSRADTIRGGKSADELLGSSGPDDLFGNGGPDALDGGTGTDECYGGKGADIGTNCETVGSLTVPRPTPTPIPTVRPTPTPDSSIGPGMWLVGPDIAPGRYRAFAQPGCYVARLSGLGGDFDEIIANDFQGFAGPLVVDVLPSDVAFEFDGECGRFAPYTPPVAPTPGIAPGAYVVGSDITPGIYRAQAQAGCYWERRSSFSLEFAAILANDFISSPGQVLVEIANADEGFYADDQCGSWAWIGPGTDPTPTVGPTATPGPTPTPGAGVDTDAPVLVSFDFSPRTVDVSASSQTVIVTMRLTDATGVSAPSFSFSSRDTTQSSGFGTTSLISGTTTDGTWQSVVTIDQGSAPGIWDATLFPLRDTIGNSNSSFGPPPGFPDELTVN